jgi:nucleotide-binding universal stress UspA family protein
VALGIDGSARCGPAIQLAFEEARRRRMGITVIYAWQVPMAAGSLALGPLGYSADVDDLDQVAKALIAEVLAPWSDQYPDVDVRQVAIRSPAAAALIEQSRGAELLVVGSRGRGGFAGLLLGSVSQTVLHHAGCPVLIARHPTPPS